MKVTKRQLRRIINEEIDHLKQLSEVVPLAPLVPAAAGMAYTGGTSIAGLTGAGWAALTALLGGSLWWKRKSNQEKDRIAKEVDKRQLEQALSLYLSMEGMGTKEENIYEIFNGVVKQSGDVKTAVNKIYRDFSSVLDIVDDTGSGDLIEWLIDDGVDDVATVVRYLVKGEIGPSL